MLGRQFNQFNTGASRCVVLNHNEDITVSKRIAPYFSMWLTNAIHSVMIYIKHINHICSI